MIIYIKMDIIVFTDGSYIKARSGDLCGYGIYFPNGELDNIGNPFIHKPLTNQRAELYAIYKAVKMITEKLVFGKAHIYTDSEYSIKSLTIWLPSWEKNNWKTANKKPVKNLDIILAIYKILKSHPNKFYFYHVRSHTGKADFMSQSNDIVDKLAKTGAFKSKYIKK
jgi:ribonuclease HI